MSNQADELRDLPFPRSAPMEPPVEWAELREKCPFAAVRLPSGDRARMLTRYEDVRKVLTDPRFSRDLARPDAARLTTAGDQGFMNARRPGVDITDGPGHTRWRRLVGRTFTMKRVEGLRPRIGAMVDELLDAMTAHQGRPVDLVPNLALPLPVGVICELLGVPASDQGRFTEWANQMLSLTRYDADEVAAGRAEFAAYMTGLIAAKRAEPGDDLLSELISVTDAEDGRLSEAELLATSMSLLAAGHETTASMIGKMAAILLSHRERYETLLADPSLVPAAVEEVIRFDAMSEFGLPRYATETVEVGESVVEKGTTVLLSLQAANRDQSVFASPETWDAHRGDNHHLGFSAGAHFCMGSPLARVELQEVLAGLLRRLPTLRLAVPAEQLRRREGLLVGGYESVPVTW
ncbi:cytochrome P450 [Streptantibioticus ferralitis]|uniref:Cytochrome P450 n=1 Tax=Streptantibioticus ferralitis TaxID=236510 RepID=A0ABT5Z408_9ACTN|nr:cytochrome P450 [Streptantibioticus ferralitis]MDF2258560.1 cytochrome P450 [Streptantibioticus ferralitis]